MKEFGSDFHYSESYFSKRASLCRVYSEARFYAFGRQPIIALIEQNGWKRIWMPAYFCYEVIAAVKKATGIDVVYYHDYPGQNDVAVINDIEFEDGDVLFRVNYFGLREKRGNSTIPVPVIEDHSHDLMSHWSLFSNADWCIASLRKSLPLAEGGMIWSPKKHELPEIAESSAENEKLATDRWQGMKMKAEYLADEPVEKDAFRELYLNTEEDIDCVKPCGLAKQDDEYLHQLDINAWYDAKRRNWRLLQDLEQEHFKVLQPESDVCYPFSLTLLANSKAERDQLRMHLIRNSVYPAILWQYEGEGCEEAKDWSERILSVHCDGRYSADDIKTLKEIITTCHYE